jgi:hypothetical protein
MSLVYLLVRYDLRLGKDFMEEVPQTIDLATNVLQLPNCSLKGLDRPDKAFGQKPLVSIPETDCNWADTISVYSDYDLLD